MDIKCKSQVFFESIKTPRPIQINQHTQQSVYDTLKQTEAFDELLNSELQTMNCKQKQTMNIAGNLGNVFL